MKKTNWRMAVAAGGLAAAGVLVLGLRSPPAALARLSPLSIIARQIHKPNMLVVLDTSGSLTGVPGGSFDNADEVGVDCDNGNMCRGGISLGTCDVGGKVCSSDSECASSTCQTGRAPCVTTSDCQPIAGHCATGQSCYADVDCPARSTGRCAYSGSTCSTNSPCSPRLRCRYGNNVTCSTNNDCRPGICSDNSTTCVT